MEWLVLLFAGMVFLAYANGVNDNFKGVATLYGSRTLSRRQALAWATLATMAGSLTAAWLATALMKLFSGKGLVPDVLIAEPGFTAAVMLGAAATIALASRLGIPISTTHALIGALAGSGLAATHGDIHWQPLLHNYIWPLIASPVIALAAAALLYQLLTRVRQRLGIGKDTCICIGEGRPVPAPDGVVALQAGLPELIVDTNEHCRRIETYRGRLIGLPVQRFIEGLHVLSSGAVSFARGLNDTPKIVGVALVASHLGAGWLTFAAAIAMGLGGLLHSRRIATTMADGITDIQHGPGLTANIVTSIMVLFASKWGVPVSTTHVSCGAIFGIGTVSGKTDWRLVQGIAVAWLLTLPIAAGLAGAGYLALS